MLVLNRLVDEIVTIGEGPDRIEIMLVSAKRGEAKLGISAPRNVPVHRKETYERLQREKGAA